MKKRGFIAVIRYLSVLVIYGLLNGVPGFFDLVPTLLDRIVDARSYFLRRTFLAAWQDSEESTDYQCRVNDVYQFHGIFLLRTG